MHFYEDEFNQAKCTTQPTPLSDMVIKEAKKKGIEVYLDNEPDLSKMCNNESYRLGGTGSGRF